MGLRWVPLAAPHTVPTVLAWLAAALAAISLGVVAWFDSLEPRLLFATTPVVWAGVALSLFSLWFYRPARSSGWYEAAASITALAAGDTLTALSRLPQGLFAMLPSALFLVAYACAGVAMLRIMRRWAPWHQLSVLIDSLTMLVGAGTVITSLLWWSARDADLMARPTLGLFPILDLLLVGVVGRYWFSAGGHVRSVQLVCAGALALVVAHLTMLLYAGGAPVHPRWSQLWLLGFVLVAAAISHPSCAQTGYDEAAPGASLRTAQAWTLAASVALPPVVLLCFGLAGGPLPWVPVCVGGLLTALLMGVRLALLIGSIRAQTDRIDQLARSDSLTGAANRRHWDQQFGNAVTRGLGHWVLMIDLDRFKDFNDSRGHLDGDQLLRDAVQAWQQVLPADALLARYGGEEFTVLLGPLHRAEVRTVADALRRAVPGGQTCSIGIARSDREGTRDDVLRDADLALYAAKRQGRNRAVFFPDLAPTVRNTADE
ncbi:MAG: GGDEF domain-containing protein [Actinomycetales bacterium]